MKHGPQGVREATNRVLSLRSGLTRADCWERLRSLREPRNEVLYFRRPVAGRGMVFQLLLRCIVPPSVSRWMVEL